jgi:hypothetical protein
MIYIEPTDLEKFEDKYSKELVQKAINVIDKYTLMIQRDAREIIDKEGYRDTGDLINSIKPSVKMYADKVAGEVNSGTKYARFVHEGAEHDGNNLKPHFVSFKIAPSMLQWARRHGIIQKVGQDWAYIDKSNQEHIIKNINTSGIKVYTRATKFFEKPFEALKDKFIEEMNGLMEGV